MRMEVIFVKIDWDVASRDLSCIPQEMMRKTDQKCLYNYSIDENRYKYKARVKEK